MRIGFFSPTINRVGGGEWVTMNMINSLKTKGHEIIVYSAERVDAKGLFQFFGRKVCFDEEIRYWPYVFDPFDPKSLYDNAFRSFVFRSKCDLLIDTFSNSLMPWCHATYFQGNAFVSLIPKDWRGLYFMPFKTLLRQFNRNSSYKDKIAMACSHFSAKMIEEAIDHEIQVLYPPISNFFRDGEFTENSRNNIVITVSRFAKEKHLEIVPKIAKMASKKYCFVICGACRCSKDLLSVQKSVKQFGVEDNIRLMPNISRMKLRDLMRRSKVCLHTGMNEPFGVSIIESMASGCIPVVPDCGGPREFVPKQQRYENIDQAVSLIESSLSKWSPEVASKYIGISNRFSEEQFCDDFLRIMKLED